LRQWRDARRELRAASDALTEAEVAAGIRQPMSTRMRRLLPIGGAVLVIVAAVGVWFAASAPARYSDQEYIDAATKRVSVLLSVDADDPKRSDKILAGATGSFEADFAQSADAYTTYVKETGAKGEGSVDAAALQFRSPDGADVMLVASVQVTKERGRETGTAPTSGDDAPIRTLRLIATMVPVDGQLKIDRLVMVS